MRASKRLPHTGGGGVIALRPAGRLKRSRISAVSVVIYIHVYMHTTARGRPVHGASRASMSGVCDRSSPGARRDERSRLRRHSAPACRDGQLKLTATCSTLVILSIYFSLLRCYHRDRRGPTVSPRRDPAARRRLLIRRVVGRAARRSEGGSPSPAVLKRRFQLGASS